MIDIIISHWQLKLAACAICAGLKFVGEIFWHDAQRFIMPVVIAIAVSILTIVWWLGLCVLPMIGPITLGYKDYGSSNGFARGCWLFVICLVGGLGCVIFNHLSIFLYIPWVVLAGVWGATTRNLPNFFIAPITGLIISAFIWFIY